MDVLRQGIVIVLSILSVKVISEEMTRFLE
jgi:hypothetical protein